MNTDILTCNEPARCWEESFLLGNGSIGLSLWGGKGSERISLNHDTFWAGHSRKGESVLSPEQLASIRELIARKEYGEAEDLLEQLAPGRFTYPYQPMGMLTFTHDASIGTGTYRRSLDLSRGIYSQRDGGLETEGFVSYPDSCSVIRFSSRTGRVLSGRIEYTSPYPQRPAVASSDGTSLQYYIQAASEMDGFFLDERPRFCEGEGISGIVACTAVSSSGTIRIEDDAICITDADEFILYICTGTDWDGHDPAVEASAALARAAAQPYEKVRRRHAEDVHELYARNTLSLTGDDTPEVLLPDTLSTWGRSHDPKLIEAVYNFGRYLLIASSREGSQPANLQGIWNTETAPPWWSNYTMNINLEMNYWGACITGLADCSRPLYDYAMRLMENGKQTAQALYGAGGWCSHHQSDIWAQTHPRGCTAEGIVKGHAEYSLWPFSGVWISIMAWDAAQYLPDRTFIEERVLPLLEGSIRFLRDFLFLDEEGMLTTAPSTSPENRFSWEGRRLAVSSGSTMDLSLSKEAIQAYLELSERGICDAGLTQWAQWAVGRIQPFRIGRFGQLQEWSDDVDLEFEGHRHQSHLYSLFPGNLLHAEGNEEFRDAAAVSLQDRAQDTTGWSTVWKIALAARLGDPQLIEQLLDRFLKLVDPHDRHVKYSGSGCYPNLLCAHPPFQIDGNLGIPGVIPELFVQRVGRRISLLPALPESWTHGTFRGYYLPGGTILDITWSENMVEYIQLHSTVPAEWEIWCSEKVRVISLQAGDRVKLDGELKNIALCQ